MSPAARGADADKEDANTSTTESVVRDGDGNDYEGELVVWFGPEAMMPGVAAQHTCQTCAVSGANDPITVDSEMLDQMCALAPHGDSEPATIFGLAGTDICAANDTEAMTVVDGDPSDPGEHGFDTTTDTWLDVDSDTSDGVSDGAPFHGTGGHLPGVTPDRAWHQSGQARSGGPCSWDVPTQRQPPRRPVRPPPEQWACCLSVDIETPKQRPSTSPTRDSGG